MLFKNEVYLDDELLIRLSKQIGMQFSEDAIRTSQKIKKAGLSISPIEIGGNSVITNTENIKNDKYDLLREFNKKVNECDAGIVEFDFKEAEHIFQGQLISFCAKIIQPNSGDENIGLINSLKQSNMFKGIIENQMDLEDVNNKQLFNIIFNDTDTNIPIYFSVDDKFIVVSEVNSKYLDVSYEEFQELFDEEINVTLLVDKKYSENQEVILMDMMKDIFKIGRDLRRKMSSTEQEKYIIREAGPAIQGKVLYMYK